MSNPHLYSKYFTPAERRALKAIPENDLSSEINIIRVHLGRFFGSRRGATALADLKSQLAALHTTSAAASMVANLIRTHIKAHNPDQEFERDIQAALDLLRLELGLMDFSDYRRRTK